MSGMNQQTAPGSVLPPVPTAEYHVAVNGQATGPFNLTVLQQMVASGQLTGSSLVWKTGMVEWIKAETISELKFLFANEMPPIPPMK